MINYDTRRGGINVTTDTGPTKTVSNLVITDARHQDSGNYTCSASNTQGASSNVFVSHGKQGGRREGGKEGGEVDARERNWVGTQEECMSGVKPAVEGVRVRMEGVRRDEGLEREDGMMQGGGACMEGSVSNRMRGRINSKMWNGGYEEGKGEEKEG